MSTQATMKRSPSQFAISYIPGVSFLHHLTEKFGGKLIFMLFCTNHLVKGFNYVMLLTVFKFFFQAMQVPGNSIDRYQAIAMMPWAMKPLLGVLSDAFPIFGYKKMPYLMFLHVVGVLGLAYTSFIPIGPLMSPTVAAISLFMCSAQWMACDLFAEAVYSRRMAETPEAGPDLMAYVWGGNQLAAVVASALSGVIMDSMKGVLGLSGAQWAFASCFPSAVIVIVPTALNYLGETKCTPEETKEHRYNLFIRQKEVVFVSILVGLLAVLYAVSGLFVSNQVSFYMIFIIVFCTTTAAFSLLRPVIGKLVLFNTISYMTMLSISGPSQYFFTDNEEQYPEGPHFSDTFYASVLGTVGTLCAVVAIFIYNKFLSTWKYRTVYMTMIIFATCMQLTNPIIYSRLNVQLGIPDKVFMIGDTALVNASSILFQMPGFLILSHMCPKNMEATMFALLASLSNFVINVQAPVSGYVAEMFGVTPDGSVGESHKFDNLWIASLLCTLLKLTPLFFLWLIPNVRMTDRVLPEGDNTSATVGSPYERCTGKYKPQEHKEQMEESCEKTES